MDARLLQSELWPLLPILHRHPSSWQLLHVPAAGQLKLNPSNPHMQGDVNYLKHSVHGVTHAIYKAPGHNCACCLVMGVPTLHRHVGRIHFSWLLKSARPVPAGWVGPVLAVLDERLLPAFLRTVLSALPSCHPIPPAVKAAKL